jgi:hypothetical protein
VLKFKMGIVRTSAVSNPFGNFKSCKWTGTRDFNWLKVIWYDGSWLGESPADIRKIFYCPFNFKLKLPFSAKSFFLNLQ